MWRRYIHFSLPIPSFTHGSVGWVLNLIAEHKWRRVPAVAVLPLGTGNDLARSLHWGSGFKVGGKIVVEKKDDISVETILRQVRDANCIFPAGMSPSDGTRPLDAAHDASHDADGGRFMIT